MVHIEKRKPANKEFTKTFKFNGHWFVLKSIFDKDNEQDKFDFDKKAIHKRRVHIERKSHKVVDLNENKNNN